MWLIVIFCVGLGWWSFIQQVVLGIPFGNNPAPDYIMWIIVILIGIVLPVFLLSIKMITTVSPENIIIRFSPLKTRIINVNDIVSFSMITYKPIRDYGGWGIRWNPKKGIAYNVSGNKGVKIKLIDSKSVLIGSQKADELEQALKQAKSL
jgi:hypothetical protein